MSIILSDFCFHLSMGFQKSLNLLVCGAWEGYRLVRSTLQCLCHAHCAVQVISYCQISHSQAHTLCQVYVFLLDLDHPCPCQICWSLSPLTLWSSACRGLCSCWHPCCTTTGVSTSGQAFWWACACPPRQCWFCPEDQGFWVAFSSRFSYRDEGSTTPFGISTPSFLPVFCSSLLRSSKSRSEGSRSR